MAVCLGEKKWYGDASYKAKVSWKRLFRYLYGQGDEKDVERSVVVCLCN